MILLTITNAALGSLLIQRRECEEGLDLLRRAAAVYPTDPAIRQLLEQTEKERPATRR